MTKFLTESGIKTLWTKIKAGFLSLNGGTVDDAFTVTGKKISFKTNTNTTSDQQGVNVHGALYVWGGLLKTTGVVSHMKTTGSSNVLMSDSLVSVFNKFRVNGSIGVNVAPGTHDIEVKTDAQIPKVRTNRIIPIDDENFIIGNDDNAGTIKVSTDMQGWDLDGFDSNWSINEGGNAKFSTLTLNGNLYVNVKSGGTTTKYTIDLAKALQLGLFVKA